MTTDVPRKGERTRRKLIDATAELLRRNGYHATGLSDIVEHSGAPRGSLYFYFPGGKDQLAIAAIEASGAQWRRRVGEAIANAPDLAAAVTAIIDLLAADLESNGWDNGCPVAAVALESTSEAVRSAVAGHFAAWREASIAALGARFGIAPAAAVHIATFGLAAIEGALLLARVERSRAPLDAVAVAMRAMATLAPQAAITVDAPRGSDRSR